MIIRIILLIMLGVLGVITIIGGVAAYCENDTISIFEIAFCGLIIAITILFTIDVIKMNSEITEKITGRGVITTSDDIDYTDGGGISSDKITFYYLLKNGDKIVVDKTEWESGNIEFTYKVTEVERVKE